MRVRPPLRAPTVSAISARLFWSAILDLVRKTLLRRGDFGAPALPDVVLGHGYQSVPKLVLGLPDILHGISLVRAGLGSQIAELERLWLDSGRLACTVERTLQHPVGEWLAVLGHDQSGGVHLVTCLPLADPSKQHRQRPRDLDSTLGA